MSGYARNKGQDPNWWKDKDEESADAAKRLRNKGEKKRRNLVNQVERIRETNLTKRDEIFNQTWKELSDTQISLSVNPPTNARYLLMLHRESLKRDNELLAVKVYHDHLLESARRAYEAEFKTIEEEFNHSRGLAKEKLLDSLDERRRKLKEEKDLVDFSDETVGSNIRNRATQGLRNRGRPAVIFSRGSPGPSRSNATPELSGPNGLMPFNLNDAASVDMERNDSFSGANGGGGSSSTGGPPGLLGAEDPLSMAALNVDPHIRESAVFHQLTTFLNPTHPKRGGGRRHPVGFPGSSVLANITPGHWLNHPKSNPGVAPTKAEEADADLDEINACLGLSTKKRGRGAAGGGGGKRAKHD